MSNLRDVYIIGVGNTPCGRFPDKPAHILAREAAWLAIKDAEIHPRKIEIAFCGHVYQGMGVGQRALKEIGLVVCCRSKLFYLWARQKSTIVFVGRYDSIFIFF